MADSAGSEAGVRGQVVLVTGGGTGLGQAISEHFLARGFRVAATYSRSEAEAKANVEKMRSAGGTVELLHADISIARDVEALVGGVYERFGRLDVVVNNASLTRFVPFQNIQGATEEVWDSIMDVNLKGTFMVSRAMALRMMEGDGGAIVNISSTAGVVPSGSSIAYAVSKAGIIHLTKAMSIALAPKVRVNCVAPALMQTRWWDGHDDAVNTWMRSARFQKAATVEDVAEAVGVLALNASISGQTLVIDQANMFL